MDTCKKGLSYLNLNSDYGAFIDSDNVFWCISNNFISQDVISFYQKTKDSLDKQLNNFRFAQELTAVYINPTDRCNASCPYCYIPQKLRKDSRSLSKQELKIILKKIAKYFKERKKRAVIVFHASEPLLAKDIVFWGIRNFNRQFKFGLQTNATLIEKEDVEFLKEYRVGVGISLDSSLPSTNDRLRPISESTGNFQRVVRAIEWFNGYEGLNVITTITKFNVRGLPNLVKFLHKKKVPCVLLNPIRLTQKTSRSLKPDEKELSEYFIKAVDKAIELSKQSDRRIIIGNFANIILGIIAPLARRLMCDISPCGGGRCFLTITASGEMIPCGEFIGLKGFSGGNIFKTGLEQAMQSMPFKMIRNRIAEKIDKCSNCILRNICGAPCPAELKSLGNMYQASIFCEFYKEIIKYAFGLIAKREEKYCLRGEGLNNLIFEYNLGGL